MPIAISCPFVATLAEPKVTHYKCHNVTFTLILDFRKLIFSADSGLKNSGVWKITLLE